MLMLAAALLMPLQNGSFSQALAGWHAHRHGGSLPEPVVRVESGPPGAPAHVLVINSQNSAAGGVSQVIHVVPGSLWRLTVRAKPEPAGVLQIDTPSGAIGESRLAGPNGAWQDQSITFRVPSPGEAEIHLDSASDHGAPVSGRISFADVQLEPVTEPDPGEIRVLLGRKGKRPIDAKQEGQFIEYLCRLIPSMLAQQVDYGDFEEEPPFRFSYKAQIDRPHRPWYPVGAVHVAEYSFETQEPFNGKRSQKIVIPLPTVRAGIAQDGYYLQRDLAYRLRLQVKAEGQIRGRAVLRDSKGILAQAEFPAIAPSWTSAALTLRSTRDSTAATLAFDFAGPGTVWLDRIYLIGADAVLGLWRPDVVDALRRLRPGVIRFGGTTVEGYDWQQTIGPWDRRAPFTTYWGGLEPNFAGLDEFVQLCRHVGAEPLICIRWTEKTPADAAAEVEYLNGRAGTKWGALRAQNGHPEPYGVKYWQIGNEVGGHDYTKTIADFARTMRAVDPTIKLISSYPSVETLLLAGDWLDYLAPHDYDFGDLTEVAREFDTFREQIRRQGQGRDIRVAVTEWNTTGGQFGLKRGMLQTLGNALSCSRFHNLIQRNADLVEMGMRSNLIDSFGSGVLITGPGWMYLAPTYYAEQLYQRAAGSFPLAVERDSPLPWQLREPDISATLSDDAKTLRLYAVNSTALPLSPTFQFIGINQPRLEVKAYVLKDSEAKPDSEAMNSLESPDRVAVHLHILPGIRPTRFRLSLDPYSLTLLELRME
jgi:alpha-N-arabinofuranosidase